MLARILLELVMSKLTGDQVYLSLMDLDILLQDGGKMVRLKFFLASITPDNPSLIQLNDEVVGLTTRLTKLCQVLKDNESNS